MDSNNRVFMALIQQLQELLCILKEIHDSNLRTEIPMSNDCFRMHLKMRNVISTLVKKTINGQCPWEELASTNNTSDNFPELPVFENHITSEEYVAESIKIHNAKPGTKVLMNGLLTLQELLGDILDSSCQISNCHMKLTSGIYVYDLITVHQQYEAVWNFLNSVIVSYDLAKAEGEACFTEEHSKLLRCIRLTFKELTKIKLEMEYYFKANLVELQFEKSDNKQNTVLHNYIPYADCSYFPGVKTDLYQTKFDEDSLTGCISRDVTETSLGSSENTDLPPKLQLKTVGTQIIKRSHVLATKEHDSNLNEDKNHSLNQTLKHPMDTFHFEQVVFKTRNDNIINLQSPNVVGTDLMEQNMHSKDNVRHANYHVIQDSLKENEVERKQNYSEKENHTSERIDEHVIDAREMHVLPKSDLDQDSINKQDHRVDNSECTHLSTNEHLKNYRKNNLDFQVTERLEQINRFNSPSNYYENAMFSVESLIEIFQKNEVRIASTSESSKEETSSFCLWPVAGKYIYVSNARRGNRDYCSSYVSDQRSEKSLEPIYTNHNFYDSLDETNDVGENANTFSGSYNGTLSAFKSDKYVVAGNKTANPIINGTYSTFSRVQNRNYKCFNGGVQELKTMAVQFAHFGDAFVINNKQYTNENVEIVNGSYTNNLNSFISIFTSNLGSARQLNHQKLFRRAMNTLGGRPFARENIFNNMQTLKSSSGPYRLFDINGYPLTDNNGNVLKDPYGKCLVDLDLMGLPKADGKIFDAAGNSSKDINFDPTQKPKTSTILLKLTDNFKRPLHLFDKYGRPLTDSYGKLLVNIHGRPLLRFDNFGQPSTDYRGGPLFTVNGLRWLPKNAEFQEELSESDTITKQLQNNPCEDSYDSLKNLSSGKDSLDCKDRDKIRENNINNESNLNTATSDIWSQLEMVLTKLPKKKKMQPQSKETFIVNNFSVLQSPLEQEKINKIIYPDKLGCEETNKTNLSQKLSSNVSNIYINSQTENINKTNSASFESISNYVKNLLEIHDQVPYPRKINDVDTPCSKCLHVSSVKQEQGNCEAGVDYSCGDTSLSGGYGALTRSDNINKIEEKVRFSNNNSTPKNSHKQRNQQCVYNFTNEIFRHNCDINQISSPRYSTISNGKSETTDYSPFQLTSAGNSKYTTDILTSSDPMILVDSSACSSNKFQSLQKTNYYSRGRRELDCQNIKPFNIKNHKDYVKNYEVPQNHLKNETNTDFDKKVVSSPLKRVPTVPHVLKKYDRLYDITLTDIVLKGLDSDTMKQRVEHDKIPIKNKIIKSKRPTSCHETAEKFLENYSSAVGDQYKLREGIENINRLTGQRKQAYDSPFRFNSSEEIYVDNIEVKYVRGGNGEVTSTTSVNVLVKTSTDDPQSLKNNLHIDKSRNKAQLPCKISTKVNGNSNHVSKVTHPNKNPIDKIDHNKNKTYQKKYVHTTQKVTPTSKECNLVSLLGSPMRYVLNKLDLKKSSKQKSNRMNQELKKPNKRNYASNRVDQYKNFKRDKERVLAFRSKSCVEMRNKTAIATMSYSGNEDSKNVIRKSPEKAEVRRTSSDITHYFEKCGDNKDMKNQDKKKKPAIIYKLKHEPHLYAIKRLKKHKVDQGDCNPPKKYYRKNNKICL